VTSEPIFTAREMGRIADAVIDADGVRTRAGARHVLRIPSVRALAEHPALVALARSFIGEPAIPFRATLFDKSAALSSQFTTLQRDGSAQSSSGDQMS